MRRTSLIAPLIALALPMALVGATTIPKIEPLHTRPAMVTNPPTQTRQKAAVRAVEATLTPTPTLATVTDSQPPSSDAYRPVGGGIIGTVSFYSRDGCLGCSANFITASGEPLDDTAFTLAVTPGAFPMGTMVLVTNLTSHRSVIAKVNDTGGFAQYGRIADLSLATYTYLQAQTDVSMVMIEPVTN